MKITINGDIKEINESQNLKQLIDSSCKNSHHVICELNEEIIKSDGWQDTLIKDNDKIELVSFVGGG